MFYKLVSALHVLFSLIGVAYFCLSIYNVKNPEKHINFSKKFIWFGIAAAMLSFILVAIPIFAKGLFPYADAEAIIPERYYKFLQLDYLKFSYLNALIRGLLFIFLCFRILQLRRHFDQSKIYPAIQVFTGLTILSIAAYLCLNFQFLWLRGLLALFISYALIELLIFFQKKKVHLKHSTLGIFTFLVYLQTGLLGGISNFVPEITAAQGLNYLLLRFFPLIITGIYYAARTIH